MQLHEFVDAWTVLDPEAEGSIGIRQLPDLIAQLSPPLGLKDKNVTSQNMMQVGHKPFVASLRQKHRPAVWQWRSSVLLFLRRILGLTRLNGRPQIMKDLQIPIKEDRVWYNPTFLAFVKRVIATNEVTCLRMRSPFDARH